LKSIEVKKRSAIIVGHNGKVENKNSTQETKRSKRYIETEKERQGV
jgi:hypothetical protein